MVRIYLDWKSSNWRHVLTLLIVAVIGARIPTLAEFEMLSQDTVEEVDLAAEEERRARREAMYASWGS